MPNLLYVNSELLSVLRQHRAYQFWSPILFNQPIRHIPPDERLFHSRDIKIENGAIYLTVDMKFVYCRNKTFSFIYANQDLAFRLTEEGGILKNMDGKQFTALIGKVADVISSSEVELAHEDLTYHPFFDSGNFQFPATALSKAPNEKAKLESKTAESETVDEEEQKAQSASLVLGKYKNETCEEIVTFRKSSKKSYVYLSEKYDIPETDIKEICKIYALKQRFDAAGEEARKAVERVPIEIREQIVKMKKVSKKSYKFLSDRFKLPSEVVQDICAQHLKRPRKRKNSNGPDEWL